MNEKFIDFRVSFIFHHVTQRNESDGQIMRRINGIENQRFIQCESCGDEKALNCLLAAEHDF